jgi:hypothetical protein
VPSTVSRLPYGKAHDSLVVEHDADGHHHALLLTVEQALKLLDQGWSQVVEADPG